MDALQLAAHFAAYTWYNECHAGPDDARQASRFAHDNWRAFVGTAPEGLGRLLSRVRGRARSRRRKTIPLQISRAG